MKYLFPAATTVRFGWAGGPQRQFGSFRDWGGRLISFLQMENSLRSDSVFFSYNAKIYTQVLLQILSGDPEPDILSLIYIQQHSQ